MFMLTSNYVHLVLNAVACRHVEHDCFTRGLETTVPVLQNHAAHAAIVHGANNSAA